MKYDSEYWQGRIDQQEKWIKECGETLEGYQEKMPNRSIADVRSIFIADQNELARLKTEKARAFNSGANAEQQLATVIHSKMCNLNHEDGCGWHYENWEKPGYSRKSYLEKARNILKVATIEQASAVINRL